MSGKLHQADTLDLFTEFNVYPENRLLGPKKQKNPAILKWMLEKHELGL
ncbi:hypothetical protein JCM15765_16860 [Paradesulfitobacterium aromaticivorans]